jgi:hypothetical protein
MKSVTAGDLLPSATWMRVRALLCKGHDFRSEWPGSNRERRSRSHYNLEQEPRPEAPSTARVDNQPVSLTVVAQ